MKFLIINGPNLNMLGKREKEHYGSESLEQIQEFTQKRLKSYPIHLDWFQSNGEGDIIDKIHSMVGGPYDALIINPGAYSHTSLAILDALQILEIPIVEIHLSNVFKREEFRQTMLTARGSNIIMVGLGRDSYFLAVLSQYEKKRKLADVSND